MPGCNFKLVVTGSTESAGDEFTVTTDPALGPGCSLQVLVNGEAVHTNEDAGGMHIKQIAVDTDMIGRAAFQALKTGLTTDICFRVTCPPPNACSRTECIHIAPKPRPREHNKLLEFLIAAVLALGGAGLGGWIGGLIGFAALGPVGAVIGAAIGAGIGGVIGSAIAGQGIAQTYK